MTGLRTKKPMKRGKPLRARKPMNRGTKPLRSTKPMNQRRKSSRASFSRRNEPMDRRSKLRDDLDTVVSRIVRFGVKGCPTCTRIKLGDGWNMVNSHVFSRRIFATRFDYFPGGNCVATCWWCNVVHMNHPEILFDWFRGKFGQKAFDDLYARFVKDEYLSDAELEAKLTEARAVLAKLKNGEVRQILGARQANRF